MLAFAQVCGCQCLADILWFQALEKLQSMALVTGTVKDASLVALNATLNVAMPLLLSVAAARRERVRLWSPL